MKLLIHDLTNDSKINSLAQTEYFVIDAEGPSAPCLGCFGCWLKTPGKCVLKDRIKDMGAILSSVDEVIIISKVDFGAFSSNVKKILDRSISYIYPFFKMINHEMHHVPRYSQNFKLHVFAYADQPFQQNEKDIFANYVSGMAINLNVSSTVIEYVQDVAEVQL